MWDSKQKLSLKAKKNTRAGKNPWQHKHRGITKDPAPYGERPIEKLKCYLSSRPTSPPVAPKETGNFSVPRRDAEQFSSKESENNNNNYRKKK